MGHTPYSQGPAVHGPPALFLCAIILWELCSPLGGFGGFGPGFIEGHKLLQRIDGAGVSVPELGFAAVEGVRRQRLDILIADLSQLQHSKSVHWLARGRMARARFHGPAFTSFLKRGWSRNGSQTGSSRSRGTDISPGMDRRYSICSTAASDSPTIT